MAKIPKEIQDFMEGKMAWVATSSIDGIPNATPKGSVQVIDDEHIIFADLFSLKTRENLLENANIAITVVDEASFIGYQITGTAEMIESGPIFEALAEDLKESPMELPPLEYAVYITVDSVYDQSIGPEAGTQIA